jgi:hypothetical protein
MVMPLAWTFDMRTSPVSALAAVAPSEPAITVEAAFFRNSRRCISTSPKIIFGSYLPEVAYNLATLLARSFSLSTLL